MRTMGFSSGALAYSDFRRGVEMLRGKAVCAVELSALREEELCPLVSAVDDLDLNQFSYVAVHAPSRFKKENEATIVELLLSLSRRDWPIVLHPDAIIDYGRWRDLGSSLLIENMDKRKPIGRTAAELHKVFSRLPNAGFCFDIGHARQVDPTMTVAYFLLREFGDRLRQLHVSEVNSRSTHDPLSYASILSFGEVSELIPETVPIILETPVAERHILPELRKAKRAFSKKSQRQETESPAFSPQLSYP